MDIEEEFIKDLANEIASEIDKAIIESYLCPNVRHHSITFIDNRYDYGQQRVWLTVKTNGEKVLETSCNRDERSFDEYVNDFSNLIKRKIITDISYETGTWFKVKLQK